MFKKSNVYKKISKLLKLDKPLVIFDIETTGLSLSADKIVELAYIKIWPNGMTKTEDIYLNPEIKISLEAQAVHGIKNRDVKNWPKFRNKAQELWDVFNNCYYSGFNIINFDLPLLRREFIRMGMDFEYNTDQIIDTREIFLKLVPRTLGTTYEYYCKKITRRQHRASNDTDLTLEILVSQLEKYKEIRDWEFINKIHKPSDDDYSGSTRKFYWLRGEAYLAFSKHKDKPLFWVVKNDPKFLEWILRSDFGEETKNIIRQAQEREKERLLDKFRKTKK